MPISSLNDQNDAYASRLKELRSLADKLWLVGGNIPAQDYERLRDLGVDRVFATGSDFDEITQFIRENCS